MVDDVHRTKQPHDRLTRLCDLMTRALRADPECDTDVRCVVFLTDGKRGGLVTDGYDESDGADLGALVDVVSHLQAIMRANGKDLQVITVRVPDSPAGLDDA